MEVARAPAELEEGDLVTCMCLLSKGNRKGAQVEEEQEENTHLCCLICCIENLLAGSYSSIPEKKKKNIQV